MNQTHNFKYTFVYEISLEYKTIQRPKLGSKR